MLVVSVTRLRLRSWRFFGAHARMMAEGAARRSGIHPPRRIVSTTPHPRRSA